MMDYLTYAGIYRDVWLEYLPLVSLASVKVATPGVVQGAPRLHALIRFADPQKKGVCGTLQARLLDAGGTCLATRETDVSEATLTLDFDALQGITPWDIDHPVLYTFSLVFTSDTGRDQRDIAFGFRESHFTPEGFFLNGKPLKLLGLNRHQSFPYIGYALGRAAQEKDAEILKYDLGLNLVRTAHYPQSPWFLDHCDRIGLLVLEEIPGWQHIGAQAWQDASVDNVEAMIRRDWNHPSIIMWGVRINESPDDHDFYIRTNQRARALDPTRPTGGIRCIENSELLEDVYTMNDFILGTEILPNVNHGRIPLRSPRQVTNLTRDVPYLVTEYGGHMYPTTVESDEERQAEHVRKHLEVLNAMYGDPKISGCIGWCYADYNTHKDFGSGDRICHHGVLTMFRQPKFAAHVYASQIDPATKRVMEPVTYWTRGNKSYGGVLPMIVLTNCDRVVLHYGEKQVFEATPDHHHFPHLPHPPVIFDDSVVGSVTFDPWGSEWSAAKLVGYLGDKAVIERAYCPDPLPTRLDVHIDRGVLHDDGQDCTRVMIQACDQLGNRLPFLRDDIIVTLDTDAVSVVGPTRIPLRGGYAAFWLKARAVGMANITIAASRFSSVEQTVSVVKAD